MGIRSDTAHRSTLIGVEGELVTIAASVEPRSLEEFLEALARLDFPINPRLHHAPGRVIVEFPAYSGNTGRVSEALRLAGFDPACLAVRPFSLAATA